MRTYNLVFYLQVSLKQIIKLAIINKYCLLPIYRYLINILMRPVLKLKKKKKQYFKKKFN